MQWKALDHCLFLVYVALLFYSLAYANTTQMSDTASEEEEEVAMAALGLDKNIPVALQKEDCNDRGCFLRWSQIVSTYIEAF
ncbi:hypothetical protein C0Q44_10055 [Paenibacillus sp. PCH8]|uniref:hypothetical protein n=1 Tax=Paenibacillus sp. PCH8 TaxID=2066524 RepID=UPI000CF96186|nr:hypothetical protein [Paenibacillus sp. PCH8]PQP84843.1 hypothetical protein C0Q44_10055 [Paenibacillus sp. PCH8]